MSGSINLKAKATQARFADLVGITQPAVAEKIKIGVLVRNGTIGEWLIQYCDQIRKEAAGRSGKAQDQLTQARIEESRENAAEKRQRRLKDAKQLLLLGDVQVLILELPIITRTMLMQAGDEITEAIETKYSIKLDDNDVSGPIQSALGHIGDCALQLQRTFETGEGGSQTETSTTNT